MRHILIFVIAMALISCGETWRGVKKDSEVIGKSISEAGSELGEKIKEVFDGDENTEGEK